MSEEFKEYQSKPIIRKALQMKSQPTNVGGDVYLYRTDDGQQIRFAAHQMPEVGDWIVYLNDEDIYHCTDKVFRERNIVE